MLASGFRKRRAWILAGELFWLPDDAARLEQALLTRRAAVASAKEHRASPRPPAAVVLLIRAAVLGLLVLDICKLGWWCVGLPPYLFEAAVSTCHLLEPCLIFLMWSCCRWALVAFGLLNHLYQHIHQVISCLCKGRVASLY